MQLHEPTQERAKSTKRKLLTAAKAAFLEVGYEQTRVADIVARAGSSTGNFYYRFKNKDALFQYMLESYVSEAQATIDSLPDNAPDIATLVLSFVHANVNLVQSNKGFYRASSEVSAKNPAVWSEFQKISASAAERMIVLAEPHGAEMDHDNRAEAMREAVQLVTGFIANQTIHNSGPALFGSPAMIGMLCRAMLGVLRVSRVPDIETLQPLQTKPNTTDEQETRA